MNGKDVCREGVKSAWLLSILLAMLPDRPMAKREMDFHCDTSQHTVVVTGLDELMRDRHNTIHELEVLNSILGVVDPAGPVINMELQPKVCYRRNR